MHRKIIDLATQKPQPHKKSKISQNTQKGKIWLILCYSTK
jgi:hypothetical protein